MSFFKGTSIDQDTRYKDKTRELVDKSKFPAIFGTKVSTTKVNMEVMRPWIAQRITELLGIEDEIAVEYVYAQLESTSPDPKEMTINLKGFLEANTTKFMKELWTLLVSAQENPTGIPQVLLDIKKAEMEKQRQEEETLRAELDRRRAEDRKLGVSSRYTQEHRTRRGRSGSREH